MLRLSFGLFASCVVFAAEYKITWVGNDGPSKSDYVANCARSLWVAPDGTDYAASMWDEGGHNIALYLDGRPVGQMGGTKESQGSAIAGNARHVFAAQQIPNGGKVGRYDLATRKRDRLFAVGDSQKGDVITGLAVAGDELFACDFPGNRVRVFSLEGVLLREWAVVSPGALAAEPDGKHVWVADRAGAVVRRFDAAGQAGAVIRLDAAARPGALHVSSAGELWVGDQGPDQNLKVYADLAGTPRHVREFGVRGGYLSDVGAPRGTVGPLRFTRIMGVSVDAQGRIHVLCNPWGGTWDLGRDGATDLQCYAPDGKLLWAARSLNFEGNAAPDPVTDGAELYSGNILYAGRGGAAYKACTVDPFRHPQDPRLDRSLPDRGEHFAHLAAVGGRRILVACNQGADRLYAYHFNPEKSGHIAIPTRAFGDKVRLRNGFCLAADGDVWTSEDKTDAIQRHPFLGFGADGAPTWGAPESTPVPSSIRRLNRLEYLPASDTMVLNGGDANWIMVGPRVEVYAGWRRGVRIPTSAFRLERPQPKCLAAAGDHLFVGYYSTNAIDMFELKTGQRVLTMTGKDGVDVGNDVDSMYGLRAWRRQDGSYVVTKDDYNYCKVVVYEVRP